MPVDVRSYNPSLPPSPQQIAAQRKLAQALSRQASRQPRFTHPQQALAPLGQNLAAAMVGMKARRDENSRKESLAQALAGMGRPAGLDDASWAALTQHSQDDAMNLALQSQIAQHQAQQEAAAAAASRQAGIEDYRTKKGIDQEFTTPKLTDDQREYQQAVEQGYQGTLGDWITSQRKAGASSTSVSVGKGETEYDKTLGKKSAERFTGFQDEALAAQSALNSLDVMEQAMSQPGFYSGFGADQLATLKRAGAALGFDPEGISSMETFNAQAKSAALDAMGGSLGTGFSNADRDFVLDQVPSLDNSEPGNRALIEVQRRINRRKVEISQLARDYAVKNGGRIDFGFDDVLRQHAEQNPLFADLSETFQGGGMPEGVTEEDIEHTMKLHGLTREQVLERLSK